MKYITIPAPVALTRITDDKPFVSAETGEPHTVTFQQFLLERLPDAKFVSDAKSIVSMAKIKDAVQASNGVLQLEDADYEKLADVVARPSQNNVYNPLCAHCFVPFFKAFEAAKDSPPKEESD